MDRHAGLCYYTDMKILGWEIKVYIERRARQVDPAKAEIHLPKYFPTKSRAAKLVDEFAGILVDKGCTVNVYRHADPFRPWYSKEVQ